MGAAGDSKVALVLLPSDWQLGLNLANASNSLG